MNTRTSKILKTGGMLLLLSFVDSVVISLFLAFSILSTGFRIFAAVLLILFGLMHLFLAFFRAGEHIPKGQFIFFGFLEVAVGITWCFLGESFHVNESYLDRFVFYTFFNIALSYGLIFFWPYVSRITYKDILIEHQIDTQQETLLYALTNTVYSVFIALAVPATNARMPSTLCSKGIINTIGIWFANGLVGFLIGFMLGIKSRLEGPMSMASSVSNESDYDGIN